ncbi:MAG: hypothetical protein GKS05_08460 [Nitrospirales bacterium]|nr:hypothetical protein [Nitrospirales bacterium]
MPRPIRIQYEHAFYHVMNRGRGRQAIFHGPVYYHSFLTTLEEAHQRFDAIVHAYCLMGNHYHLLLETPRANLDRIMRHINGVYTQRYNRLHATDGPLFRGRYKAIVVDQDAYLLQLSRYIHRNPTEGLGTAVDRLASYPWSSYRAYINEAKVPAWLERETTYHMLGHRQKYVGYRSYVEDGLDEDTKRFYDKGNTAIILGDTEFKAFLANNKEKMMISGELSQVLSAKPSAKMVVTAVARVYGVKPSSLLKRQRGRQQANLPRKVAIYCCQQYGDMPLKAIASLFELTHAGSVSPAVQAIQQLSNAGELKGQLQLIKRSLDIIK